MVDDFRIQVEDETLEDLRERLRRTRRAASAGKGMAPADLASIVDRWLRHDWRASEAALNRYPQVLLTVDGRTVHAVHRRSQTADARAIVLGHGWPHSFVELLPLADALQDFHVVIPSLPGFLFSAAPPADVPVDARFLAENAHQVMTELGYGRYLTYGEDVSAGASDALAALHPEAVEGIFATHAYFPPAAERSGLGQAERDFFAWLDEVWEGGTAYGHLQATRPDTLAAGLSDSPVGLAAWILEKFREWSDPRSAWRNDLDAQLTTITLYWATNSIGTSFRPYSDKGDDSPLPPIEVPAGVAVQTHEGRYPRELAERGYRDLRTFGYLDLGGHFAAAENPTGVAAALREFAATL